MCYAGIWIYNMWHSYPQNDHIFNLGKDVLKLPKKESLQASSSKLYMYTIVLVKNVLSMSLTLTKIISSRGTFYMSCLFEESRLISMPQIFALDSIVYLSLSGRSMPVPTLRSGHRKRDGMWRLDEWYMLRRWLPVPAHYGHGGREIKVFVSFYRGDGSHVNFSLQSSSPGSDFINGLKSCMSKTQVGNWTKKDATL